MERVAIESSHRACGLLWEDQFSLEDLAIMRWVAKRSSEPAAQLH